MKIEFIKASADCFNQNTGFCYHYPTIWAFLLVILSIFTLFIFLRYIIPFLHKVKIGLD